MTQTRLGGCAARPKGVGQEWGRKSVRGVRTGAHFRSRMKRNSGALATPSSSRAVTMMSRKRGWWPRYLWNPKKGVLRPTPRLSVSMVPSPQLRRTLWASKAVSVTVPTRKAVVKERVWNSVAVTLGVLSVMVKLWAFDRPLWLSKTEMPALPSSASSDDGTLACSCPALTKVVASGMPLKSTVEAVVKLLPLTVSVKVPLPSGVEVWLRLVICGVKVSPDREKAALKVGGVVPPTMSVPMRSQSGSRLASRVQLCRSGAKGVPGATIGLGADSQKKVPVLSRTWGTKK